MAQTFSGSRNNNLGFGKFSFAYLCGCPLCGLGFEVLWGGCVLLLGGGGGGLGLALGLRHVDD